MSHLRPELHTRAGLTRWCDARDFAVPVDAAGLDEAPNSSLQEAEAALSEKLFNKFDKVQKAFRSFDKDFSGELDYIEFRNALRSMGVILSDEHFAALAKKYDPSGDGTFLHGPRDAPSVVPCSSPGCRTFALCQSGSHRRPSAVHSTASHDIGTPSLTRAGSITYEEFNRQVGRLLHPDAVDTGAAVQTAGNQLYDVSAADDAVLAVSHSHRSVKQAAAAAAATKADGAASTAAGAADAHGAAAATHAGAGIAAPVPRRASAAQASIMGGSSVLGSPTAGHFAAPAAAGSVLRPAAARPASAVPAPRYLSYSSGGDAATVATEAMDLRSTEEKMRRILGRSWSAVYREVKARAMAEVGDENATALPADTFRDVMATRGVPLTAKEVRALSFRYGEAPADKMGGAVDVERLAHALQTPAEPRRGGLAASVRAGGPVSAFNARPQTAAAIPRPSMSVTRSLAGLHMRDAPRVRG